MQETTFADIEKTAIKLQKEGKRWHFHILTPDCAFNAKKGLCAFVLENRTDGETYVAYSKERNMALGKKLVRMLHGKGILKKKAAKASPKIGKMLEKAVELSQKGIPWHHHMLFPDCIFNKDAGRWAIIFEDTETGEVLTVLYDEEPVEDLREIEVVYYKQRK